MKMFAYRGKHENFGDELNHWLWERLLPGFFDDDESQLFLGIGSILYDNFEPNMQKIVFGSDYGGYTNPPKVDRNWTFYFVRGKKTAEVLGIDPSYANQFTIGFDEIGSPYVYNYTVDLRNDLADGSNLVIKAGTLTTQINIAAATGEITVQ
jgi:hypothetical protein